MKILNLILFIMLQLSIFDIRVHCLIKNFFTDGKDTDIIESDANVHDESKTALDRPETSVIDPHSFLFDKSKKKMLIQMQLETVVDLLEGNLSENPKHENHASAFYRRLINLLITNMSMRKDKNVMKGTLHIEALPHQWELLKNCLDPKVSIRELDGIMDDIITSSSPDFFTKSLAFLESFFMIVEEYERAIFIIVCVFIVLILMRMIRHWSFKAMFVISFFTIFVLSFFITWWQLVQEAEIKLMVTQAKFANTLPNCDPTQMNYWNKFVHTIFPNKDCEEYLRSMKVNPVFQVTPALALTHLVSNIILHPAERIGDAIRILVTKATGDMHWAVALPLQYIIIPSLLISLPFLLFIIFGGSIKLGVGPFFQFAIFGRSKRPVKMPERVEELHYRAEAIKGTEESNVSGSNKLPITSDGENSEKASSPKNIKRRSRMSDLIKSISGHERKQKDSENRKIDNEKNQKDIADEHESNLAGGDTILNQSNHDTRKQD